MLGADLIVMITVRGCGCFSAAVNPGVKSRAWIRCWHWLSAGMLKRVTDHPQTPSPSSQTEQARQTRCHATAKSRTLAEGCCGSTVLLRHTRWILWGVSIYDGDAKRHGEYSRRGENMKA